MLFDVGSNSLFAFNDSARYVWELIETGRSLADLAREFAQAWGIPLSRARADLQSIITQWRLQGLLAGSENRPSLIKRASNVFADGRRAAQTRPATEWICTIRGKTIAFAVEHKLAAPIRMMLRNLETPAVPPQARLELRQTKSGEVVLVRDGSERLRTSDPGQYIGGLWQTILECIHPNVLWRAAIHGAALARNGVAVVLSAPSGSGKTTLAAGLISRGFDYLADDIVALSEPDGVIMPCPLPLSLKPGSIDVLKSRYPELVRAPRYRTKGVTARLLVPSADVWDAEPVRLRVLVFPSFTAGIAPQMRSLSSFEALEHLLTDRVWLGHPITEERVRSFLALLDETPAYAVSYGTLSDAVQLVERVIP